jgi:hypothetical protein
MGGGARRGVSERAFLFLLVDGFAAAAATTTSLEARAGLSLFCERSHEGALDDDGVKTVAGSGGRGSSEYEAEPGSAMVRTFSTAPGRATGARCSLGGEGGGVPKSDAPSSPSSDMSAHEIDQLWLSEKKEKQHVFGRLASTRWEGS